MYGWFHAENSYHSVCIIKTRILFWTNYPVEKIFFILLLTCCSILWCHKITKRTRCIGQHPSVNIHQSTLMSLTCLVIPFSQSSHWWSLDQNRGHIGEFWKALQAFLSWLGWLHSFLCHPSSHHLFPPVVAALPCDTPKCIHGLIWRTGKQGCLLMNSLKYTVSLHFWSLAFFFSQLFSCNGNCSWNTPMNTQFLPLWVHSGTLVFSQLPHPSGIP